MISAPAIPLVLLRRVRDCRCGAAAVEAAFILPLLLMLILAIFDFGRMAWTKSALDFAVQEAARCAVVRPGGQCATTAQVQAFAAAKAGAAGVPASAFTVQEDQPCGVRVRASHAYRFMTGGLLPSLMGGPPVLAAQVCRA